MYMKLKDGKAKVLTLSYDDGVVQDIRLMSILDKHGLKCTFNINTGRYFPEDGQRETFYGRMKLSEAKELYINSGHEVAVHTLTHPFLEKLAPEQVLVEILEDRKNIEQVYGNVARGFVYPYGTFNDEVIALAQKCGMCYARTAKSTLKFGFPDNWMTLNPTCHHNDERLMERARHFVEKNPKHDARNWMFYLWGHSYEFDKNDNWEVIEEFAEYMGNREDIWYATNIEVYDYVKAYKDLQVSLDETIVHNPSAIDVWFLQKGQTYCVHGGETLRL